MFITREYIDSKCYPDNKPSMTLIKDIIFDTQCLHIPNIYSYSYEDIMAVVNDFIEALECEMGEALFDSDDYRYFQEDILEKMERAGFTIECGRVDELRISAEVILINNALITVINTEGVLWD